MDIKQELAAIEKLTVDGLRAKYAEVFGEPTNGRHRAWLIKRIAWRLQANAEGGLSERARRRAAELANDADLRMTPPKSAPTPLATSRRAKRPRARDSRLPMPGTLLTRQYKGSDISVTVLVDGFEHDGQAFASLSAVAKHVTGKHWNGFHFFGLKKQGAIT